MHIVEYIDPATKKSNGIYAKRTLNPITGVELDEIIPKKTFCVCDATGKIKSVSTVNFSYAIEVEGRSHCMELETGEECNQILDADMPTAPAGEKDRLKWILDNHKMGLKDATGKRKIVIK